jgi:hypothetical protein
VPAVSVPAKPGAEPGPVAEAADAVVVAAPEVASPTGTKPPPAAALPSVPPPLPGRRAEPEPDPGSTPPATVLSRSVAPERGDSSPGRQDEVGADDDTAPMPVITADLLKPDEQALAPNDEPVPAARIRDPFEPLDRPVMPGLEQIALEQRRSAARTSEVVSGSTDQVAAGETRPRKSGQLPDPASVREAAPPSQPAAQAPGDEPELPADEVKLEQIKDLYLTAEAIGEDALGQHFDQVSDRQRQLIREYFDQVVRRAAEEQPQK